MPTSPTTIAIEHLRRAVLLRDGAGLGDGELLGRFLDRRDEAALAEIVRRHGPMVWGVCRRLLGHHDAEDAFQATFIVLVRKAAAVAPREMLGNWLYGVAHRTALQARRAAARRAAREVLVAEPPDTAAPRHDHPPDVQPLLDEELSRLPGDYRAVVVLCDLEGRTRAEVARHLGVPEGTVAGRLARARTMLATRLARRGVALSIATAAGVPNGVVSAAVRAAAGPAATISPNVSALAHGVSTAMLLGKLKAATAVALVLGFLTTGATLFTNSTTAGQDAKKPAAEKPVPVPQKGEKLPPAVEGQLQWGEPVNGLRAALAIRPVPGVGKPGDLPDLFLVVQNVSKAPLRFSNATEIPEAGTLDLKGDGQVKWRVTFDWPTRVDVTLPPREVVFQPLFPLNPEDGVRIGATVAQDLLKLPRYSHVAKMQVEKAPAGAWTGKLVTGETSGAAAEIKGDREKEKEAFTAWGKEVGGLQAGLGYPAGQKRAYSHGEIVKLVVRVRNVGKEAVKFQYLREYFVETPPGVRDEKSKSVSLPQSTVSGIHLPVTVTLESGKECELQATESFYDLDFAFKPEFGTGKFLLGYETIFGMSSAGSFKPDPKFGKLATGKLELEIKTAPPEVRPTQAEMRLLATAKGFCVALRTHHGDKNANALREYIDPRYLKEHGLTDGDLSVPMPAVGALFTIAPADDEQTFLCVVDTEAVPNKKVREAILLRVSVVGGKHYITPLKAPDPKTGSFTPWMLRTRTDYQ